MNILIEKNMAQHEEFIAEGKKRKYTNWKIVWNKLQSNGIKKLINLLWTMRFQ